MHDDRLAHASIGIFVVFLIGSLTGLALWAV
jgi:hypothetical protein